MHALLFTHSLYVLGDHDSYRPRVMSPLVDRPFLQHIIEALVAQGVQSIDLILSNPPETIESLVGNGRRWGIDISCHLVPPRQTPYHIAAIVSDSIDDQPLLIVHADTLVALPPTLLDRGDETLFFGSPSSLIGRRWTGWARLYPSALRQFITSNTTPLTHANLYTFLRHDRRSTTGALPSIHVLNSNIFSVAPDFLLPSQQLALSPYTNENPHLPILRSGQCIAPGVWKAAQARVDNYVTLIPPVYIGAQSHLKSGVTLGPNCVVGTRCLIDSDTTITNAMITDDVYIGPSLTLNSAIITPQGVFPTHPEPPGHASSPLVPDTTSQTIQVGSIDERTFFDLLGRPLLQLLAFSLFFLALPLLLVLHLYARLRGALGLTRKSLSPVDPPSSLTSPTPALLTLRLPNPSHSPWSYLFCHLLPGLWEIGRGEVRLFGISLATARDIENLPDHWRALLTPTPLGLITEPLVNQTLHGPEHPRLAADLYYAAFKSRAYDLRILGRFLKSLAHSLTNFRPIQEASR